MFSIGPPLTKFFRDKGITQDEIASQLGVSQSYVSAIINGKKPFGKKQAKRFFELYGLSPSWLLTGQGEMLAAKVAQSKHLDDEPLILTGAAKTLVINMSATLSQQEANIAKLTEMVDRLTGEKCVLKKENAG